MPAIVPGYEYDIFISYRHNDNRSGWVTEFVKALQEELAATIKEPVSIYFDTNPHDGLLENHDVDKSLEGKLKCLIFIPIVSQTYCDPKSFAWQYEFCAFNKLAKEDQFGRDVKLNNGNVASRILPIKIHDLDAEDKATIESEIGGVLRAIEFIYKEPGVNRPISPNDSKYDNLNKTDYKNQVNKVANAIKELLYALSYKKNSEDFDRIEDVSIEGTNKRRRGLVAVAVTCVVALVLLTYFYLNDNHTDRTPDEVTQTLDRAEKYLEEAGRFDDKRYFQSASDAIQKVLENDSSNERALYLMSAVAEYSITSESKKNDTTLYFTNKIFTINKESKYGYLTRAGWYVSKRDFPRAIADLKKVESLDPENKDALALHSFVALASGDYPTCWEYAKRYEEVTGKGLHTILSYAFLELGDFREARRQLEMKQRAEEFSCQDIESYQRIFLCEGNFEKLEQVTDSICRLAKCEQCPYWLLRAKMHVGKFEEASGYTGAALRVMGRIGWRLPAFVLFRVGKKDSALLVSQAEMKYDQERLSDTAYHQTLPLYSLSAIYAMQSNYKESLKWLRQYADRGFEMGSEWYIGHDPLFDEMQKDNEYFTDFIQIIQRAQAQKSAMREKIRELENQSVN